MIAQVRPSQLSAWLNTMRTHGEPVVLDVREPFELAMASVKADGFELITIPMGVIPPRLNELDPERPIACLCHHGGRSMQVAAFLQARGFAHVANIAGGINAWSAELDPGIPRY
ncbi:rhodanese-like domain-containing protein [Rhodoferax sp.]|uniref:rhodanese-like domain-containing protein n=1 Tax=Rhodoferax sp. TaxID=50421 RepID=UPI001EB9B7BB|nr:rhodanese-like domain-containing protein [Rhodoferax sp.]MBT9506325.1 sulfurtransferase [Rhodoferax sp.]